MFFCIYLLTDLYTGRAIAQAGSHWLPTVVVQVKHWSGRVRFVVVSVALWQVFP
jgi:hypothetical protein